MGSPARFNSAPCQLSHLKHPEPQKYLWLRHSIITAAAADAEGLSMDVHMQHVAGNMHWLTSGVQQGRTAHYTQWTCRPRTPRICQLPVLDMT